jgi:NTE family protein
MKKIVATLPVFFLFFIAYPQEKNIKNLVFEGAGIRGIAYGGAIEVLEKNNIMAGIEKVGGTSAGAITALCLSLGYKSAEITELLFSTNFKKFNDGRFFFPGGINRVNKYFGWYRGERMVRWVEKIIESKTGNKDITFEELYNKGFKDLYITATVLNEQKMVVLSRLTYPRMRVKDAVRISISIPFYFEAVFVDKEGKVARHPKNKKDYNIMIDGGLIGNFPIQVFDSVTITDDKITIIPNMATVGFRLDRDTQIENDMANKGLAAMPVTNLKEYGSAFYNIIVENLNRHSLTVNDWKRTVSISDSEIAPRIRKMSRSEINRLINSGRTATQKFFSYK